MKLRRERFKVCPACKGSGYAHKPIVKRDRYDNQLRTYYVPITCPQCNGETVVSRTRHISGLIVQPV